MDKRSFNMKHASRGEWLHYAEHTHTHYVEFTCCESWARTNVYEHYKHTLSRQHNLLAKSQVHQSCFPPCVIVPDTPGDKSSCYWKHVYATSTEMHLRFQDCLFVKTQVGLINYPKKQTGPNYINANLVSYLVNDLFFIFLWIDLSFLRLW